MTRSPRCRSSPGSGWSSASTPASRSRTPPRRRPIRGSCGPRGSTPSWSCPTAPADGRCPTSTATSTWSRAACRTSTWTWLRRSRRSSSPDEGSARASGTSPSTPSSVPTGASTPSTPNWRPRRLSPRTTPSPTRSSTA
ncbi:hypothetical protein NKG94_12205 [Micromonospora sp. M12]